MTLNDQSVSFPLTSGRERGYATDEVDAFLATARAAFEQSPDDEPTLTSEAVRTAGFPLVRRGYVVGAVDAALGRLEDAFAARERERALSRAGARAWVSSSRKLGQEILDRLGRPEGERFRRVGFMRFGYDVDEVDEFASRLAGYLETGEPLTADQVRAAAFRVRRRGYDETQVDAVLDAMVDVILAVG